MGKRTYVTNDRNSASLGKPHRSNGQADIDQLSIIHRESDLSLLEKSLLFILLLVIISFFTYDILGDFRDGMPATHITIDFFMGFGGVSGVFFAWIYLGRSRVKLKSQLSQVLEKAHVFELKSQHVKEGLATTIDSEFSKWDLTTAEREVALLLLKGLSLKEIAVLRDTTERTVRHQTFSVYQKSELSGRAELSAYFLEDLL